MNSRKLFRSFTGLILLFPAIHDALADGPYCATSATDSVGWGDTGTDGVWILNQDNSGGISGIFSSRATTGNTAVGMNCPASNDYTVGGSSLGQGKFTVRATYTGSNSACVAWIAETFTVAQQGCDFAPMLWSNSVLAPGNQNGTLGHACYVPGGEAVPTFQGWDESIGVWKMTVTPQTFNYGGRYVTESNTSGMQATDTCWKTGDPTGYQITGVTGGTWNVDNITDTYGLDYIGYGPQLVLYYRVHSRAPCSSNVYQTMSIACDSGAGSPAYKNNVLSATIGPTTVGSAKDGVGEVETYGVAQGEIVNIINSLLLQKH